jgi:hypothetical protein
MLRPDTQQRDRLSGGDEGVRHHTPIWQRQGSDRLAVDEREQRLALKCRRVVKGGETPNDVSLVGTRHPQRKRPGRSRGNVRRGRAGSAPAFLFGVSEELGAVLCGDYLVQRNHHRFLSIDGNHVASKEGHGTSGKRSGSSAPAPYERVVAPYDRWPRSTVWKDRCAAAT